MDAEVEETLTRSPPGTSGMNRQDNTRKEIRTRKLVIKKEPESELVIKKEPESEPESSDAELLHTPTTMHIRKRRWKELPSMDSDEVCLFFFQNKKYS